MLRTRSKYHAQRWVNDVLVLSIQWINTMPESHEFPSSSVDRLIAGQLPPWLKSAQAEHLQALHLALQEQQRCVGRMEHVLSAIPDLQGFAATQLQHALTSAGLAGANVRDLQVVISQNIEFPSAAEKLYKPVVPFTSRQSLLAAAMHNFEESEGTPSYQRTARLEDGHGKPLELSFEQFVVLVRKLDVGASYQLQLRQALQPRDNPGQAKGGARQAIEALFQDSLRARMAVAVHQAVIKGELDKASHAALLPLLEKQSVANATNTTVQPRQLYLLGKCIVGVVTLEIRSEDGADLHSLITWLPDANNRAIRQHASWQALYDDIARELRQSPYRAYFARFLKAQDQAAFLGKLASLLRSTAPATAVQLDGRNLNIDASTFRHHGLLVIDKIFADARYLAVPTGDEDLRSRHVRLNGMLSAGLDLLGLAGLFVPVLGELMLVASALQLADEVYEGYQEWRIGDREGALGHLFNVAQTLVLATAIAGAGHAFRRSSFVDSLVPRLKGDRIKLGREADVAHIESNPAALMDGLKGGTFTNMSAADINDLLAICAYSPEQIRRLRVEHGAAPARLLDMRERFDLYARFPDLGSAELEAEVQRLQGVASTDQAVLINTFNDLSPRAAQEIIDHSSSAQLQVLQSRQRIALSMAERARWSLRDSRLDRACLGIRLHQAVNVDTEQLVLGLVARRAPWPASTRFELRAGSEDGLLLFASPGEGPGQVITLIRREGRYFLAGDDLQGAGDTLLRALPRCLASEQKAKLGASQLTPYGLREWLLAGARADRELAAQLIGMTRIGPGVRPLRRFADGRLGYALSGHGESSQQAIRRGIHQIFSTLSETQLNAYLRAVTARGVSLWDHYAMLQRQLSALRAALDEWQSQWRNPIDAIRRQRVADTLRRSWRRKLVDVNDNYELMIDGEHVSHLPTLPAGLDFAHVRRLVLRDMGLESINEDFLRRFPNIVELDLSHNRLTAIPAGIERLTQLRRINLSSNRLSIDAEGNSRLAQLILLDSCELSFNPLMQAPDLSGLRHVRHLHLRATGQVDVAQLLERASWRALVDLRDNRIWQLQHQVEGLSQRLSRFELHDNPLDETSQQQLDRVRDTHAGPARGRPSHRHATNVEQSRSAWLHSDDPQRRISRQATWSRLQEEPGSSDLFRFLADFAESEDFAEHPGHFRRRMWRILDACENSEALRDRVFRELNQTTSCEDRLLLQLGQIEVAVLVEQGIKEVPEAKVEERLLHLGRQLHRLDLLDRVATRHIERLRSNGVRLIDEIEVRLYYRTRLVHALDLPIHADEMHFPSFANVNEADLRAAQRQVLQDDNTPDMLNELAQRPYWQEYVRQRYPERFEALVAPLHERLLNLNCRREPGRNRFTSMRAKP
ncbi:E3 ubiquitin-protein ligase sspH1 [compost metagenome]